ncbi:MAG TPA: N-acetylmuramoyl-L-alanine amidase [Lachnospiraceae bacterium]|jgi:N-acetylmuramoyl-L-alanine amidase|nr:N-acetylmuramoyl-L-alanine amidase [Lachnospiraceae bacterium]HBY71596.1 N-acetylmuramoyl-L-alanine amidase [Lachnospiraceae bacterium]HCA69293.1 N-acetylmuramoyl-L-alanine amidase [Lachnospiraceae bacterium]HCM12098.1 N-acetylmuramoyl-L-alanine amidase [Lachnospiraceae bacterium]HCR41131.1 N-acetylmuramoyl-L-alanine amidase [Lachnospiraceae bacterium]
MKRKYFNVVFLGIIFLLCALFSEKGIKTIKYILAQKKSGVTVVIDAGHGGFDPGKVGINKALEKDINLSIAFKLKRYLEQNNIKVIMTREDGKGLYQASDQDKKRADMKKRVSIINSSDPCMAISIHQNSYPQESIKGAQVFYHANSEEGKILAEILQERIKKTINDGNHRLAKSNSSYYLLKNTKCPLVIVECGFLSNRKEADLLCNEEYQGKMAWAICLGVLEYLDTSGMQEVY